MPSNLIETFQRTPPVTIAPSDRLSDQAAVASSPGTRSGPRAARRRTTPPWWFAAPAMALFAFVVLVPSARGLHYAFTDWDGLDPNFSFIGLGNFIEMTRDPVALR